MAVNRKQLVPSFVKAALNNTRPAQLTFNDIKDTNILSTSSFRYDQANSPLKSTQQLNIDWSAFENHTFFMSAEAKVNLGFEQIINGYPFDGSREEIEDFFDKLTGFDAWLFTQFPKYRGQLHFSGSWIEIQDHAGALFPELSKNNSGKSILNPSSGTSMTIETQVFLPEETAGYQFILQKISDSTHGFAIYVEPSNALSASINFSIFSGSFSLNTSTEINKGEFNHIAFVLDRELGPDFLKTFKNDEFVDTSRNKHVINNLGIDASKLIIGSGSTISVNSTTITPTTTFSGTLDELRLFHSTRTENQLKQYSRKSIFSTDELKLYLKFNEPANILASSPNNSINSIILDSSGNSLHALITNFTSSLREDVSLDTNSRMIYEKNQTAPNLFASHEDVTELNARLLFSASLYDIENPNLITKLIPQHYLQEAQALEGFSTAKGGTGENYSGNGIPGEGELSPVQVILSFLYIYAKFFDEMKLYVDTFKNLKYVNYNSNDTIPNTFLMDIINDFGITLPPLFNNSTIDQYINAENIDQEISTSEYPLQYVQNELLRRILVNLPSILKSKGTQYSIKSFLRALGVDPENSVRIREFGGPTVGNLSSNREIKKEPNVMTEFITSSLVVSPFLTSSRIEVGYPNIQGAFVSKDQFPPHGISNNNEDGLLTSGSWTWEAIVKWTPTQLTTTHQTQSLCRLHVTGSGGVENHLIANFIAISASRDSTDCRLALWARPEPLQNSPTLNFELPLTTSINPFDGDKWNLSFGRYRTDDPEISSREKSKYFIRAAKQINGEIIEFKTTGSFFKEGLTANTSSFTDYDTTYNLSGSYISIGQGQTILSNSLTTTRHLNYIPGSNDEARENRFTGYMSNMRFWTKALSELEWREHVRNYKSRGVYNPLTNFNYNTTNTGSFERLRLEAMTKQPTRSADGNGEINFLDFSENNFHLTGSGFVTSSTVLVGEIFDYSYLSPLFDEASTNEKIRSRSYKSQALVDETPWANVAPIFDIPPHEQPTDDPRFSIEFSLIDALNRDIITMFATFDALDNALGSPELMFSPDYPDLEKLRDIYFNRIKSKLNFKSFFEFFRWFDITFGTVIEQLIPRKTNFKGTNFVIESHLLERHKIEYYSSDMYLTENQRLTLQNTLLLQQIAGNIRKF